MQNQTTLICLLFVMHCVAFPGVAEELSVLAPGESQGMLRRLLLAKADQALDRRQEKMSSLSTVADIRRHQEQLRADFQERLGPFPPRTALNGRTVGRVPGDGFRIERVVFESRPQFFVTANFYVPAGPPPFPAVLFPCGHSEQGKAEPAYQRACAALARSGVAVLCYDPIGQGERKQLLDANPRFRATSEHMLCGVAPILLGENLATYRIWDGIRGIDYLASRPEVDARRLGCAGNSGGGLMTSYLMALDDRIQVAVPSCFITTTRRKNRSPGPGDAEQNVFGQLAIGLDHADFLNMRAPRPALVCAATQDFVPIEGSWEAFREAKRVYTRFGAGQRLGLAEADAKHGLSDHLRDAMVRFLHRWLPSDAEQAELRAVEPFDATALQCTPSGQVLDIPGARSIFDINRERAKQLGQQRAVQRHSPEDLRVVVRRMAGVRRRAQDVAPPSTARGSIVRQNLEIEKFVLDVDGMAIPLLLCEGASAEGTPILLVHSSGKAALAASVGLLERLASEGRTVAAVDLRGYGETQMRAWRYSAMADQIGSNAAEFFVAYMLGESLVGQRADDLLAAAAWLRDRYQAPAVELQAEGAASIPALHAAALEPSQFAAVQLSGGIASWEQVIDATVTKGQLENVVHGALRHYDLPDLRKLYTGQLRVADVRDALGRPWRQESTQLP